MKKNVEIIIKKYKDKKTGVFIDDANIFHSQKRIGYKLDWKKVDKFIKKNFDVSFIKLNRGVYPKEEKLEKKIKNKLDSYEIILKKVGFEIIQKDLKKIYTDQEKTKYIYKCDFDSEIGFDIGQNLQSLDSVILISGDSDFVNLSKKVQKIGKGFLIICFDFNAPWEIRKLHHLFFEDIINEVSLKK